jgi:PAS domain S-box-containing protein
MDMPDRAESGRLESAPTQQSGLMDLLGVAAVLLDGEGRIALWSRQAEELFGYSAQEALGRFAGRILVHEADREAAVRLFADVMATGESWSGVFPVRHKDGSTKLLEFRNTRLQHAGGDFYALGIVTDAATLRQVERDAALSTRLISQTPLGLAVFDSDLRYVAVNPALERLTGVTAAEHLGRPVRESPPFLDADDAVEATLREVRATGTPRGVPSPTWNAITPGRCRTSGWRTRPDGFSGSSCRPWTSPIATRPSPRSSGRGSVWR